MFSCHTLWLSLCSLVLRFLIVQCLPFHSTLSDAKRFSAAAIVSSRKIFWLLFKSKLADMYAYHMLTTVFGDYGIYDNYPPRLKRIIVLAHTQSVISTTLFVAFFVFSGTSTFLDFQYFPFTNGGETRVYTGHLSFFWIMHYSLCRE